MIRRSHPALILRLRPWLALVTVFAFVAAGFISAEHHHHEPAPTDRTADCAACTLAHAPAIAPSATTLPAPLVRLAGLAPATRPAAPDVAPARRAAPRAPPTA